MTQISAERAAMQRIVEAGKFAIGDLKDHLQRRELQLDNLDGIEQDITAIIGSLERLQQDVARLQSRVYHYKDIENAELANIWQELGSFEANFQAEAMAAGYQFDQPAVFVAHPMARIVVPLNPNNNGGIA